MMAILQKMACQSAMHMLILEYRANNIWNAQMTAYHAMQLMTSKRIAVLSLHSFYSIFHCLNSPSSVKWKWMRAHSSLALLFLHSYCARESIVESMDAAPLQTSKYVSFHQCKAFVSANHASLR